MAVSKNIGSVDNTYSLVDSEFRWKINNLCCMGCKNVGDAIKSPIFVTKQINATDMEWYLKLYPKGSRKDSEKYMSLYLCPKVSSDIKADVTFTILNNKEKSVAIGDNHFEYTFKSSDTGRGYEDFVLRSFIHDPVNDILDKDEFTILCKIITKSNTESLIDSSNEAKIQEVDKDDSSFHENIYESLLDDSKFGDVVLTAEGKTIKVNKCLLTKSSSVFANMFESEMKEKLENTVEIADVKYDVLKEMLRFVYAGKINNIDTLAGELAIAADKYALDELKVKCEKTLMNNLIVDNVIQWLQLADTIHMKELKENAIAFIVENARDVTARAEFSSLPIDIVVKICQTVVNEKCQ